MLKRKDWVFSGVRGKKGKAPWKSKKRTLHSMLATGGSEIGKKETGHAGRQ